MSKRSAKRAKAALARSVQPAPPRIAIGRSALHSIFCSSAICASPGQIGVGATRGASATSARLDEHVLRQRDHDRARPSLHGDVERAVDDLGNLGRALDLRRPFGDRAEKGAVVHLLEGPAADHRPFDLSDEQDHRSGVVLGDVDAVRGVGRARAAGDETHPRPAGQAALGQRHHRRPRLLSADDHLDRGIVHGVERGKIGFAGYTIDSFDPLGCELVDEDLPAGAWA